MRKQRLISAALLGLVGALAGVGLLPQQSAARTGSGRAAPPVPTPPNVVTLEPIEKLGKDLLYDNTMSNPEGYACAQCHAPTAGFTSGLESIINLAAGVPPGVVPGRWDNRKAYGYSYAAYSPEGPYYDATLGVYIGGNFWDGRAYDTAVQARAPPSTPTR